jgi:N-acetylmuramoyl-L-alanine amidase
MPYNTTYADILNKMTESDTVVVMSAGNNSYWAENSTYGYLYGEDVNYATGGSPGSFTNVFTVASIDNDGSTGTPLKVDGTGIFYSEGSSAANAPMASIGGEYSYIAIDGVGTDEEMAALAEVLDGKIAVVSRGSTSFFQKANAAVENGAVGFLTQKEEYPANAKFAVQVTDTTKALGLLASYVLKAAVAATGAKNRETRNGDNLIVLNSSAIPAILVECGFISSNEECLKLFDPEYQKLLAQGIANGISEFMPPVPMTDENGQAPEE